MSHLNPGDFVDVSLWAALDVYVGVICACLPRIYNLIMRAHRSFFPKTSTCDATPLSLYAACSGTSDAACPSKDGFGHSSVTNVANTPTCPSVV
jgi:hypothetical protein